MTSHFTLPEGNFIDIWVIKLTPPTPNEGSQSSRVLDIHEIKRMQRFKFEKDRHSFQKRRIALRHILAMYLNIDASKLKISRDNQTKPCLNDYKLEFNTSVSHEYALVAISNAPVGIDIEYHKELKELIPIAERVFSPPELAYLNKQHNEEDRQRSFYQTWCLKEAYLKAIGLGLSIDPRQITFDIPTQTLLKFPPQELNFNWQFQLPNLLPEYSTAVATPFIDNQFRLLNY